MRVRIYLIVLLTFAMPAGLLAQAAEPADDEPVYVTNLGRSVMTKADLIVHGLVDQSVKKVGSTFFRKLTVIKVLWGESEALQVSVSYLEPKSFGSKDEEVILALDGDPRGTAFELVGRRAVVEEGSPLPKVLSDYIEIEETPGAPRDRAVMLAATVKRHIEEKGEAALVARVELLLLVANYPEVLNHDFFEELRQLRFEAEPAVSADIELACRGMVMLTLKSQALVQIWKGDRSPRLSGRKPTESEVLASRMVAVEQMRGYVAAYPEAFDAADGELCGTIAESAPAQLVGRLNPLIAEIKQASRVNRRRAPADAETLRAESQGGSSFEHIEKREDATGGIARPGENSKTDE